MRVVQRNLVYVVGLALELCSEDTLKAGDYFGQFGRIVKVGALQHALCLATPPADSPGCYRDRSSKSSHAICGCCSTPCAWHLQTHLAVVETGQARALILYLVKADHLPLLQISVSRSGPYGTAGAGAKHGPSGSAYVTFRFPDDARKCITTVHAATWEGMPLSIVHKYSVWHITSCFLLYAIALLSCWQIMSAGPCCSSTHQLETLQCCRQAGQGVLRHHQVLQRLPEGPALQQHRLPVPPRRRCDWGLQTHAHASLLSKCRFCRCRMQLAVWLLTPQLLHAAMDADSYTKEQTKSAKFVSLVHAVSIATPAARAAAAAAAAQNALAPPRLPSASSTPMQEDTDGEPEQTQVCTHESALHVGFRV